MTWSGAYHGLSPPIRIDVATSSGTFETGKAAAALHARALLLISKPALEMLGAEELQALAAYELGHDYVWVEYDRASNGGNDQRRQELELLCDAIGIVILHQLGMDTSRLMAAVEKMSRCNHRTGRL